MMPAVEAVNVCPTRAVPLIVGSPVAGVLVGGPAELVTAKRYGNTTRWFPAMSWIGLEPLAYGA